MTEQQVEWGTWLLVVVCLLLAWWTARWLLSQWDLSPRRRADGWTRAAMVVALGVLLGCVVSLVLFGG